MPGLHAHFLRQADDHLARILVISGDQDVAVSKMCIIVGIQVRGGNVLESGDHSDLVTKKFLGEFRCAASLRQLNSHNLGGHQWHGGIDELLPEVVVADALHLDRDRVPERLRGQLTYYADWLRLAREGVTEVQDELSRVNQWAAEYFRSQLTDSRVGAATRAYLRDRGISEEPSKKFGLGLAVEDGAPLLKLEL